MMIGYDPDFDAESKMIFREEFVRALLDYPQWAVHQAFDTWMRTMTRRPSPAEIVILIGRATGPLHDEIARRDREAKAVEDYRRETELTPEQIARRREIAERATAAAGFTQRRTEAFKANPMAITFDAAESAPKQARKKHWSEGLHPDHPQVKALRLSRIKAGLIQPSGDEPS